MKRRPYAGWSYPDAKVPTDAENLELVRRAQDGDVEAKDEFVLRNMPLVMSVAKRYAGWVELQGPYQAGVIGLLTAIERYNFEYAGRATVFTYANEWVRNFVSRAARVERQFIAVPKEDSDMRRKREAHAALNPDYAREYEAMKDAWQRVAGHPASLDRPDYDTRDTWASSIADPRIDDGYEGAEHAREKIRTAMEVLSRREREVMTLRYGLDGSTPMSLVQAGERLGVMRERVRQIQVKV